MSTGIPSTGDRGKIIRSWSSANVSGSGQYGGLIGRVSGDQLSGLQESSIEGVWSSGRLNGGTVSSDRGGLYGLDDFTRESDSEVLIRNVWTASETRAEAYPLGRNAKSPVAVSLGYWSRDLAPVEYRSDGSSGEGVDDIRTLNPSHFSGDFWDFGTDSDFPLLNNQSRSEQAAQIASGISKIVGRNGGTVVLGDDLSIDHLTRGASFILGAAYSELELDTNGLASGANGMPAPSCEFSNNEVRANTNYNNAVVAMTLDATSGLNWVDRGACVVSWEGVAASKFTVRMIVSSTYGTETTILTIDYPAEIADDSGFDPPPDAENRGLRRARTHARSRGRRRPPPLSPRRRQWRRRHYRARDRPRQSDDRIHPGRRQFQTDGGVTWATISVFNSGSSSDIFNEDNQTISLPVSVTDSGGQVSVVTLTLAAIPELVFNDFSNLTITLPVSPGQTILAAEDFRLVGNTPFTA